jgi:hypothetical protein
MIDSAFVEVNWGERGIFGLLNQQGEIKVEEWSVAEPMV